MSTLFRPVRVRFYRDGARYKYVVLAADSLQWLGEGWGGHSKRSAVETFRQHARESGWITDEIRAERMKGAA